MIPVLRGSTAPLPGRPAEANTHQAISPANTEVGDLVRITTWNTHGDVPGSVLTIRAGYTQLVNYFHNDGTNDGSLGVAWKIAEQAGAQVYQAFDTSSPNTDCRTALRVYQKDTFDTSAFPFAVPVSFPDGNIAPDPGNIAGLDSSRDYLIEVIAGWWLANDTIVCTPGAPAGFANLIETAGAGWSDLAMADQGVSGLSSIDPGTFTDNVTSSNCRGSVACAVAILGKLSARRAMISHAVFTAPEANLRRAMISHAVFTVPEPANARRAIISHAVLRAPDYAFPGQISYMFHPSWARYRYQAGVPTFPTARRAVLSHAVLTVPVRERRAMISHAVLQAPSPSPSVGIGVDWGGGTNVQQEPAYTAWLGRQPDIFGGWVFPYAPNSIGINGDWTFLTPNPNQASGSIDDLGNFLLTRPDRRAEITVGPMPWVGGGGSNRGYYWGQIAAGQHDAKFTSFANIIKNTYNLGGSASQPVYIRLAWEMELNFSHGVGTDATKMANFGPGWRRIVDLMRAVSPHFKFFFCPSLYTYRLSQWGLPWINAIYPGNDHVDVIGSDHYDAGGSYPPSTLANQTSMWNNYHVPNLQAQDAFANSKGKPQAFGEWGVWHSASGTDVGGNDNPLFIEETLEWIQSHNFVYAKYFEGNNSTAHSKLMTTEFPNASLRYRQLVAPLPHPW